MRFANIHFREELALILCKTSYPLDEGRMKIEVGVHRNATILEKG
jgi:hypothetical protein